MEKWKKNYLLLWRNLKKVKNKINKGICYNRYLTKDVIDYLDLPENSYSLTLSNI